MPSTQTFLEAFIPLFVTIDAFGLVPVFLGVTATMTEARRRHAGTVAVAAATMISLAFMLLGNAIFAFLGISTDDFRIAGGLLLLVLGVHDLLIRGKPAVHEQEMVGLFPLAMPLIAGPATLTTVLVLSARADVGRSLTALSLAINFLLLLFVLRLATRIAQWVGVSTLQAFSKLVMVLLAAIAVNLIRVGVTNLIRAG